jgi:hypothetical protein
MADDGIGADSERRGHRTRSVGDLSIPHEVDAAMLRPEPAAFDASRDPTAANAGLDELRVRDVAVLS